MYYIYILYPKIFYIWWLSFHSSKVSRCHRALPWPWSVPAVVASPPVWRWSNGALVLGGARFGPGWDGFLGRFSDDLMWFSGISRVLLFLFFQVIFGWFYRMIFWVFRILFRQGFWICFSRWFEVCDVMLCFWDLRFKMIQAMEIMGWLVVWNHGIWCFHILGISSSQLTKSIIFQRGRAQPPTRNGR